MAATCGSCCLPILNNEGHHKCQCCAVVMHEACSRLCTICLFSFCKFCIRDLSARPIKIGHQHCSGVGAYPCRRPIPLALMACPSCGRVSCLAHKFCDTHFCLPCGQQQVLVNLGIAEIERDYKRKRDGHEL